MSAVNWYADGLRFECTQCGNCCTGDPGYVWLSESEQKQIAGALGLDLSEFLLRYTRLVHGRISLREHSNGDCMLLTEDRRCSVNSLKPRQCLAFPFWPRLVASRESWEGAGARCPGINRGAHYAPEEVDTISEMSTPKEVMARIFRRKDPPA